MWKYVGIYLILLIGYVVFSNKKASFEEYKVLVNRIVLLMLIVTTFALILEVSENDKSKLSTQMYIKRNGYGEGQKEETLSMQIDGEDAGNIKIKISPRRYSKDELQAMFDEAEKMLGKTVLGDNKEADHVDRDLHLVRELQGFPFTILWELSRYDVMDMNGKLVYEEICKTDPKNEGVPVKVTGILRYESEEQVFSLDVVVFSREDEGKDIRQQVKAEIEKLDNESQEEEYVTLPSSVNGKTIIWSRQHESKSSVLILILGMTGSVLMVCLERQKKEKSRHERREQMIQDYPEIINQFTMLMRAGMTAKNVWKKVAEEYQEQKRQTGTERAAYEEILHTWKEMQSGIPEAECYERFARRCDIVPYMKMGALLAQNLKKGSGGIADMLYMEAVQAMEDRKSRARRLGEEAGTKLLVPMLMMLIIVLIIVIVPAFLSIQV